MPTQLQCPMLLWLQALLEAWSVRADSNPQPLSTHDSNDDVMCDVDTTVYIYICVCVWCGYYSDVETCTCLWGPSVSLGRPLSRPLTAVSLTFSFFLHALSAQNTCRLHYPSGDNFRCQLDREDKTGRWTVSSWLYALIKEVPLQYWWASFEM